MSDPFRVDERSSPKGGDNVAQGNALGCLQATGMLTGEITVRVRYAETDRMGLLHHANYLVYFEQARTELLRDTGRSYRDLEDAGFYLVLAKAADHSLRIAGH